MTNQNPQYRVIPTYILIPTDIDTDPEELVNEFYDKLQEQGCVLVLDEEQPDKISDDLIFTRKEFDELQSLDEEEVVVETSDETNL